MLARFLFGFLLLSVSHAQVDDAIRQIELGNLRAAETLLANEIASNPGSARAHYLMGFVRFRSGRFQQAEQALAKAGELAPRDPETWKLLGMTYSAVGDFESAVEPYRKACRLSGSAPDTCYYLARNYYSLTQFELSVKVFRDAIAKAPDDWRLHRGFGLSLEAVSENEQAEEHLLKSVRLSGGKAPPAIDPRTDLGAFLFRHGRTPEATPFLEAALRDHPDDARAHFELARCLAQNQDNEIAASHLEAAVKTEPRNWPAHQLLGKIYMRLGKTAAGRRHLDIAREGIIADTYGSRTVR